MYIFDTRHENSNKIKYECVEAKKTVQLPIGVWAI